MCLLSAPRVDGTGESWFPCPSGARPHDPAGNELQKSTMKLGKGPLRGSSQERTFWSRRHFVRASLALGYKRARDIAGPAHLGALVAAATSRPGCDTRCSHGWTSTEKKPRSLALPLSLKQPPPLALKPSVMKTEPLPSCMLRKQPWQRTKHGSKQLKDTTGAPSRTRQCQRSNGAARPLSMTIMMWNSLLPSAAFTVV